VTVEVGGHDLLGGGDGQRGHLTADVGDGLGLRRLDVGLGLLPHADDLGVHLGPLLASVAIGVLPGLLDDPGGLVLGLGQLGVVLRRLGLGRRLGALGGVDVAAD